MKPFLFAIWALMLFAMVGAASAEFNITLRSPNEYFVQNSTTVLFNWTANNVSSVATNFSCFVYNTSVSNPSPSNYSRSVPLNTSNNTATSYANITLSFANEIRVKWFVGCEAGSLATNSSPRFFDVDTFQFVLSIGAGKVINLSTDSGQITTAGNVSAQNYSGTFRGSIVNSTIDTSSDINVGGGYTAGGVTIQAAGNVLVAHSVIIGGNVTLVQDASVNGSMNPFLDNLFSLGNSSKRWLNGTFSKTVSSPAFLGNISGNITANTIAASMRFTGNVTGNLSSTVITVAQNATFQNNISIGAASIYWNGTHLVFQT